MELLTEFTGWPAGTDARAPLLGSLRTGTPVVSIVGIGGVGKTTAILAYAQAAARVNRVQAVRHNVTALDQLHNDLVRGGGIFVPTPSLGERRSLAAAAFTTSAAPFTDATDRPWASFADLSLLDHLIALGRVKYIDDDLPEPSPRGSDWLDGCVMAINKALLPAYRQGLLRLINGIRTILRLILVRVLSALSQCPDTINAVLVLLAASRRHGLRSEPSDYTLPVLTPKSVVIGETARLC